MVLSILKKTKINQDFKRFHADFKNEEMNTKNLFGWIAHINSICTVNTVHVYK